MCDTYIYDKNFYHSSLGIMLQFMVCSHIKINTLDLFVVRISYDELLDCQLSSCKSHNKKINESLFRSFPHFPIISYTTFFHLRIRHAILTSLFYTKFDYDISCFTMCTVKWVLRKHKRKGFISFL